MKKVDFESAPAREQAYEFMRNHIREFPDSLDSAIFEQVLRKDGFCFATLYPGPTASYGLKNKRLHLAVVDDGLLTHELYGTTMGPTGFNTKQLGRLFRRAECILVNACTADRQVGEMALSGTKLGFSILVETEGNTWADWTRFTLTHQGPTTRVAIRAPHDSIIPADLIDRVNLSYDRATSTVH